MWIVFCKQHQSCSQKTVHTAACLNCSSRTTALQKDDTQGLARQWPQSHTFSSAGNIYRKRSLHLFRCAVSDKISWSMNAGSDPRKKNCYAVYLAISWSVYAEITIPVPARHFISVTVRQHFRSYNKGQRFFSVRRALLSKIIALPTLRNVPFWRRLSLCILAVLNYSVCMLQTMKPWQTSNPASLF